MGLMNLKLASRRREDKSTFFSMRPKSHADSISSLFAKREDPEKLTHSLSRLTVVSVPKEYREEERFNWMTNEVDSFEYKPSDSVKATKRVNASTTKNTSPEIEQTEGDCLVLDWLFPCWGASVRLKDKTANESQDETSYSSGSTSQHDNKEGLVLEAKLDDDVSDVTSTPSEDCTEDSDESCNSSCSSLPPSPRGGPIIGLDDEDALSSSSGESR